MTYTIPFGVLEERILELGASEEALKTHITGLTQPEVEIGEIDFDTLFDIRKVQRLQDQFAAATGVASIITHPDGTPITRPSNFCLLCSDIIRKTDIGRTNCRKSDAAIGRFSADGPTLQHCFSAGLWEAGAAISVGSTHIGNWLIGQVRDETQSEEKIREYARKIGADEAATAEAFREVPVMCRERLEQVARMLYTLVDQLSTIAYQNLVQTRHIGELKEAKTILANHRTLLERVVRGRTEDLSRKSKELEQKTLERNNLQVKLLHAMDIARLGPWEYDCYEDRFIFNDHFYKLFRTTAEEVGGFTMSPAEYIERFTHPEDAFLVTEKIRKLADTTGPLHYRPFEHRIRYADGKTGHIVVRRLPVKNTQGQTVKIYGVNQDITEHKEAEAEHQRLEDQLRQAQKMESVGRLAGGVAHDYNNMLGVIIGHAELALNKATPDNPLRAHLKAILDASERSAAMTRQLLAFARKQTIQPRIIDLNRTVEPMLKMLHRLIGKQIDLAWMPKAELWPIKMDPSQIDQIMANLLVNAKDAIGESGRITIETDMVTLDEAYCTNHIGVVPGDFVLLAVSDNGCGMNRETLANIFEPFFTTKDVNHGTGLGLATVYGIIKQNNGVINVYSEPGEGTTFRIYLPRQQTMAENAESRTEAQIPESRGETILLVEDEKILIEMFESILERLGYRVFTADTPKKALEMVETHAGEIDLLITDVVMPGMNGRELATEFRSRCPGIKVLFVSGYTANVLFNKKELAPAENFLSKPFSLKDLATKVREALENPDRGEIQQTGAEDSRGRGKNF